ncbi:MAG TPA: DUF2125 domain-containing protein [Nordella sp.]|nr:DUF2125 domain-containing protein [Nordella sp.]
MPKRPWPLILTVAGIVVLAIAWCIYWFAASSFARETFDSELAKLARQGVTLDCKTVNWGGFPFRFERDCIMPKLTAENEEAQAQRLLLVIQAYMPNRAIALLDGPVVTSSGLTITHERAIASARYSGERDWLASLELPKVSAPPYGRADRLLLSARDTGAERIDVAADATMAEALLGPGTLLKVDQAALNAHLPRAALGRDLLAYLAQSGEKVGIVEIALKKGDLTLKAVGEIGITAQGQIDGHLKTTTNRLDLLMSELEQNFGLSEKDAQTFTTMIGLLQPGKTTDVTLDLIAKDGKLYWGPVKLTELPPVL